jgi:hypothetical protein
MYGEVNFNILRRVIEQILNERDPNYEVKVQIVRRDELDPKYVINEANKTFKSGEVYDKK